MKKVTVVRKITGDINELKEELGQKKRKKEEDAVAVQIA